ncbi:copper homeostasis protein CutC [Spiroplasma endosymbiont of Aspidapion aeneum]|uniref:copper homeostasis protein CutC n=1 Tax=Spiroplasma endosymbiont of Aspidapion aeneum TaxID=3066276 RepID=UPI00313BA2F1
MKNIELVIVDKKDLANLQVSNNERVLLCEDIKHNGLTPSIEFVKHFLNNIKQKIHVLVRDDGSNYLMSTEQLNKNIEYVKNFEKENVHGFMFSILNEENCIDWKKIELLKSNAGSKKVIFGKAIDIVCDPIQDLIKLKSLGFSGVCLQGGTTPARNNIKKIKEIMSSAIFDEKFELIVSGSISPADISILKKLGNISLHIGSSIRYNESWEEMINPEFVNGMVSKFK